jgi:hypothetical protein
VLGSRLNVDPGVAPSGARLLIDGPMKQDVSKKGLGSLLIVRARAQVEIFQENNFLED